MDEKRQMINLMEDFNAKPLTQATWIGDIPREFESDPEHIDPEHIDPEHIDPELESELEAELAQSDDQAEARFLIGLPALRETEFLVDVTFQGERGLFCVRELSWPEAMDIEARAFRLNGQKQPYFAGEYERRMVLAKAIVWVADLSARELVSNVDGRVLARLEPGIVEELWTAYFPQVTLSSAEAHALYEAALAYFKGQAQEGMAVPALVVDVDKALKYGGWTRAEVRAVSASDLERINLIELARSHALPLEFAGRRHEKSIPQTTREFDEFPPGFFPPEAKFPSLLPGTQP